MKQPLNNKSFSFNAFVFLLTALDSRFIIFCNSAGVLSIFT